MIWIKKNLKMFKLLSTSISDTVSNHSDNPKSWLEIFQEKADSITKIVIPKTTGRKKMNTSGTSNSTASVTEEK